MIQPELALAQAAIGLATIGGTLLLIAGVALIIKVMQGRNR